LSSTGKFENTRDLVGDLLGAKNAGATEAEVVTGAVTKPAETAAPGVTEEVRGDALPEASLDVVVRSPEVQDAEPIRSAPMSKAAATSRNGLELLADDLINPATVARNLESMRQAEQWMKVRDRTLE
jgi:uncharacterized membrane protein